MIEPYHEYPNLLDILFSFLKTEQPTGIRRGQRSFPSHLLSVLSQVVRVLGLLGALDPYKHKQQQRNTQPSKMGTPHSKPMDKTTPGQPTGERRGREGGEGGREGPMVS